VVNNAKLIGTIVFLAKTVLLFGLSSVLSDRLSSISPDHSEWFKKAAVAAILIPWIWWAAVPVCQAFGIYSTDKH
jgi:hypothetical protein